MKRKDSSDPGQSALKRVRSDGAFEHTPLNGSEKNGSQKNTRAKRNDAVRKRLINNINTELMLTDHLQSIGKLGKPPNVSKDTKGGAKDIKTLRSLLEHLKTSENANTNLAKRALDNYQNKIEEIMLLNRRLMHPEVLKSYLHRLPPDMRIPKFLTTLIENGNIEGPLTVGQLQRLLANRIFETNNSKRNKEKLENIVKELIFHTQLPGRFSKGDFNDKVRTLRQALHFEMNRLRKHTTRHKKVPVRRFLPLNTNSFDYTKLKNEIRDHILHNKSLMTRLPQLTVDSNYYTRPGASGYGHDFVGSWKDTERIVERSLIHPNPYFDFGGNSMAKAESGTSKSVHNLNISHAGGSSALPRYAGKGSGKGRVPSSNTLTLYHVAQKDHLNFKGGDVIEFNGDTYWHSDPGFKWTGHGTRGRKSRSILKLTVPTFPLPKVLTRSTNQHNTPYGTTFKLPATKMYVSSVRSLHDNIKTKEYTVYMVPNASPMTNKKNQKK